MIYPNFDFWIDDDLNDKMPVPNKIWIPSLEVKNFSYKFDYDEYSSKDKTQNEFDFETNSLNNHKINLCESFIDPELIYFEKRFTRNFEPITKKRIAIWTFDLNAGLFTLKTKLFWTDKFKWLTFSINSKRR